MSGQSVSDNLLRALLGDGVEAPSAEGYFAAQDPGLGLQLARDLAAERAAHEATREENAELRGLLESVRDEAAQILSLNREGWEQKRALCDRIDAALAAGEDGR